MHHNRTFATQGLNAVVLNRRGDILAHNCPLSIARTIAAQAAYSAAICAAADAMECVA